MSGASTRLGDFLRDTGRSQTTFAKELGVSRAMVSFYLGEARRPSLRVAAQIESLTSGWSRGPIRAVEWVNQKESR